MPDPMVQPIVSSALGIVRIDLPLREPVLFWGPENKEVFYKFVSDLCDACHVAFPDVANALPPGPIPDSEEKRNV